MPRTPTAEATAEINSTEFPLPESDKANAKQPNPYRRLFHSNTKGFEYGEDRRSGQLLFYFDDKPEADVLAKLKEHGYRWHSSDKSWRVPATAAARIDASRIANEIHGGEQARSR